MNDDPIQRFLTADTATRLTMVKDPAQAAALEAWLGTAYFAGYRRLARGLEHLAAGAPPNLIFVPGVMGSLLMNANRAGIWWIDVRTRKLIDQLALAPNGRDEADPDNRIEPVAVDYSYDPFTRACLAHGEFGHVVFPYDWRKPLDLSSDALRDRILELHRKNGGRRVHLVAHSMGGLLVRTTLMEHGILWRKIGKIAFIGTPHYGAPAIAGYLKNHLWGFDLLALLGRYLSRATLRSLWGVLSLLPAPRGVYPGTRQDDREPWRSQDPDDPYPHPCCNFDPYQAEAWALGLDAAATAQLQQVLDAAAGQHRQLYEWHRSLDQEQRDRMLVIAGVGYKTLFRLAYEKHFFGLWERAEKTLARQPENRHREGDGRVPLASAALDWVSIRYVRGVHGDLTNLPAVQDEVFRWLLGRRLELPTTPAGALSRHLGTTGRDDEGDDPGLWELEEPAAERLAEMETRLAAGQLLGFDRVRLL